MQYFVEELKTIKDKEIRKQTEQVLEKVNESFFIDIPLQH